MSGELVSVLTAQGDLEAESVCAFLAEHGIPATIRGEALRKTHGMILDGLGAAAILVAADDAEAAHTLLRQVEAGDLRLPDDAET